MLAQYTSDSLDTAIKTDNQENNLRSLANIVTLISCLEDKDKYLYYLSMSLSKRLLDADLDSISSLEWEKQLVHLIKSKLGSEFSKNLEAMIFDVESCYEKKDAIRLYFSKNSNQQLIRDFHVNVLSNCEWLLPVGVELSPPSNIILIQQIFETFYTGDPSNLNRRLEWNYMLGTMEVKYNWMGKDYIVICKPYQYFIINLFQHQPELSINDISIALKLKDGTALEPIIESLLAAPKILIKKVGEEGTFCAADRLILNPEFKSKTKRVIIREAKFEDKFKGKANVDADRVLAIQGCIVRVMKSNKIMEYTEVCKMVEKLMLKFNPTSKVRHVSS